MSQTNVEVLKRDPEAVEPTRPLLHGEARTTAPGPCQMAPDAGSEQAGNQSNGEPPRKRWTASGRR